MPSSHLILCRPLLLLSPILPSIRVFSYESTLRMRWPKYWSFSFSISPSNEHPGLIFFRMDWLISSPGDSQESSPTPQFESIILWHSAFFTVQLSHPYMTTGKAIALTRWTFVHMDLFSLLFNMLSRLVITFLPRSKLFSSSSISALGVVSSAYLRLLIFLPAILIPACASSSPAFHMMYSAYKLNKQGDNICLDVLLSQF